MLLLVVIGSLIVLLAFLILFHHNLNATKGYRLRSLEVVRSQLLLQQELLNMQIAEAQALTSIEEDAKVQAMVKPVRPLYAQGAEPVTVSAADIGGIVIE